MSVTGVYTTAHIVTLFEGASHDHYTFLNWVNSTAVIKFQREFTPSHEGGNILQTLPLIWKTVLDRPITMDH